MVGDYSIGQPVENLQKTFLFLLSVCRRSLPLRVMDGRDKVANWNKKRLEQTVDKDRSFAFCLPVCDFLGRRRSFSMASFRKTLIGLKQLDQIKNLNSFRAKHRPYALMTLAKLSIPFIALRVSITNFDHCPSSQ